MLEKLTSAMMGKVIAKNNLFFNVDFFNTKLPSNYSLFKLDTTYPLKIEEVDIEYTGKRGDTYTKTEYVIHLQDAAAASMSSFLPAWKKMRNAYHKCFYTISQKVD